MAENHPPAPADEPPGRPSSTEGFPTDAELAAQAKAAADQAIQLARLAEESARLARHLNEQVAARAGHPIPQPHAAAPAPAPPADPAERGAAEPGRGAVENAAGTGRSGDAFAPVLLGAKEPWEEKKYGRKRSRGQRRPRYDGRPPQQPSESPPQIRIRARPGDRARDDRPLRDLARNWKSVFLSTLLHVVILVILGALTMAIRSDPPINTIMASFADEESLVEEEVPVEEPLEEEGEQQEEPAPPEPMPEEPPPEEPPPEEPPAEPPVEPVTEQQMAAVEEPAPPTPGPEPAAEPTVDIAKVGHRSDPGKALLLEKYGGTAASESAVSRALDWFVGVQRKDGSWNFNDVGGADHAGDVNNPMGATSYVLLSFLGAGQTHREGKYKANVSRGLNFLIRYARAVPAGADFRGPTIEDNHNFYVQAAAAMVLCEAYAMTRDRRLRQPAQGAIDFIAAAQDPRGGGWRYEPREPGCTSVTTLQLTALFSARQSGLKVPPQVFDGLRHFYTTVKCDREPTGRYCYRAAEPTFKSASTAQASLGRMYLGASRDDEDLRAAVRILDERGPYENRYYCYYATQVMKNWGGSEWERWNESMREELIRTQVAQEGPELGSWTPLQRGGTDIAGGRLFITALSTMTLEVYYRYLPLYDSLDAEDTQPEDTPPEDMTEVAADMPGDAPP